MLCLPALLSELSACSLETGPCVSLPLRMLPKSPFKTLLMAAQSTCIIASGMWICASCIQMVPIRNQFRYDLTTSVMQGLSFQEYRGFGECSRKTIVMTYELRLNWNWKNQLQFSAGLKTCSIMLGELFALSSSYVLICEVCVCRAVGEESKERQSVLLGI